MRNNNENWQENPRRRDHAASRDGYNNYERRSSEEKLEFRKKGEGTSSQGERKPAYGNRSQYPNRENNGGYRSQSSGGYGSRNGNRYGSSSYNDNSSYNNRPSRPSFNNSDRYPSEKLSFRKSDEVSGNDFSEKRLKRPRIKKAEILDSGARYSNKKRFEYQNSHVDLSKPIRLNKFLANAGICSRREADDFIKAGVISVNGEIVTEMGVKVTHADKIMFHNQPVRSERKVYLLLNKPKDCITTAEDNQDRKTVLDIVKNACSERIYPVGRLDRNTTGVLLLTNDGDLASRLTHPKYNKKKIYHAVLDKPLVEEDFNAILTGVDLGDFSIKADALEFVKENDLKSIGIEIHSGQNRVVRRIFEKLGYRIIRLDRVFFAGLTKKNLPRGKYRFLNEREVNMLKMGAYE